ncbi:hypothetical protein ACJJIL_07310 [Microbulbifer sp. EKSA005]|uniref:hypothetical protein n=1 Tax=Microbulbifer sp. EKSA005 TaxID=3243364 RepID=UPI0040424AE5
MFFKSAVKVLSVFVVLLTCGAQAKTFKYELQDMHTGRGDVQYPDLNIYDVTSVTLTVERSDLRDTPILTSLEIEYFGSDKLTVKNFIIDEYNNGSSWKYRGKVNNAWVFRQLNIGVDGLDYMTENGKEIIIEGYVSEFSSFLGLNSKEDLVEWGKSLFYIQGELVDVTPSKVVDVEWLTADDSRLKLSLRDRVTTIPDSNNDQKAFVVDLLWHGKGESIYYIPTHNDYEVNFTNAVGIITETVAGPDGSEEYDIKVLARDSEGNEYIAADVYLPYMLSQAYKD